MTARLTNGCKSVGWPTQKLHPLVKAGTTKMGLSERGAPFPFSGGIEQGEASGSGSVALIILPDIPYFTMSEANVRKSVDCGKEWESVQN